MYKNEMTLSKLMEKVKVFHQQNIGFSFIYNDGSMVDVSLGMRLPKTKIIFDDIHNTYKISRDYETAYVKFNKKGENVSFVFNKYFAETLNKKEICFIFAHESLHVLLNHGRKGNAFLKQMKEENYVVSRQILNIAMDICINELLIREIFFDDVDEMPMLKDLCTMNSIFFKRNITDVEYGKSFEYYYKQIVEKLSNFDPNSNITFGDAVMDDDTIEDNEEFLDDVIEEGGFAEIHVSEKGCLASKNINGASDGVSAGGDVEETSKFVQMSMNDLVERYVKPRNMSKRDYKQPTKTKYNWYKENRRYSQLSKNTKLTLPHTTVLSKTKKMKLVIYADVSGSVASYTERFFGMIEDIIDDKLDMDVYVWADKVGETVKKDKETYKWNSVGYGTNIDAVLKHYTSNYANDETDSVIVITDGGYREIVREKLGKNFLHNKWIFLMTEQHFPNMILKDSLSVMLE